MANIRMDEWRSELEKVLFRAGDEGLSVKDLCKAMNLAPLAVRRRLEALKESGRLVIGKKHVLGLDDTMRMITVYRIKQKEKK